MQIKSQDIKTKNYKFYIPEFRGLTRKLKLQTRYYIYGVFKGEPHPFDVNEQNKFNPMQKLTYFFVMFLIPTGEILSLR